MGAEYMGRSALHLDIAAEDPLLFPP